MRLETKHVGDSLTHRPARRLLQLLPLLVATPGQVVSYAHIEPALLAQLADDADVLMSTLQMGLSAVGQLMAHAAPEVEDGTFSSDMVEALGWFLSEVSEISFTLMPLVVACRHHNADYAPPHPETVQPVVF
jgi:hypothetical protein